MNIVQNLKFKDVKSCKKQQFRPTVFTHLKLTNLIFKNKLTKLLTNGTKSQVLNSLSFLYFSIFSLAEFMIQRTMNVIFVDFQPTVGYF